MFDLFGIKAKRRVAELEAQLANAQRDGNAMGGALAGTRAQVMHLRKIAEEMKSRVHTHGKTTGENDFIAVCLDIRSNGKMISERRFNASMDLIKGERELIGGVL